MTEQPRRLATVTDYDGLHRAIRARVDELGATREALDAHTGLQHGYSGKILAPVPMKGLGRQSLGPMLQVLGLAIDLVVLDEAPRISKEGVKLGRQLKPGKLGSANMPEIRTIGRKALRAMLSKNGRKGGKRGGRARAKKLTPAARRRIARKAGLASAKARQIARAQNAGALPPNPMRATISCGSRPANSPSR